RLVGEVTVAGQRGAVTVPVEVVPGMVDGVVWLPTRSAGAPISRLAAATAGTRIRLTPTAVDPAPVRTGSTAVQEEQR
ncbi:MAG: hypothetical protein ACLGIF_04625, partial [Actinomycetes bacterium]